MKNLANCRPSEFMRQTVRIRREAEKWLKDTGIMEIRHRLPKVKAFEEGMGDDERKALMAENSRIVREQLNRNLSDMFDAAFESNAEGSLRLLALCCFIEPEDADSHPVSDYLESLTELVNNRAVLDFFLSLARLAQTNISGAPKN